MLRQVGQMMHNHLYFFCVIGFPILVTFFFVDIMKDGLPTNLPTGIVDLDNSTTSRSMIRHLDAMQLVNVTKFYPNVSEARKGVQRGEVYGFFYFPMGVDNDLKASRQPKVSFYYNGGFLLAGSMLYKSMRTEATLGSANVGMRKLAALGKTEKEIKAFLQPIVVDTHLTNNPTLDYNVYLTTSLVPTCIALFIFLITAYSFGMELKFNRSKVWISNAKHNIYLAVLGKMLPITILFTIIVWGYLIWVYGFMDFPCACNPILLFVNGFLLVLASEGLAMFIFGIFPSLRMSLSICALWSVLSFSVSGFTFPVEAMDAPLQVLTWLFPMRCHFMIYQLVVLNGYPLSSAWLYYVVMFAYMLLPFLVLPRIKHVMETYVYIP